MDLSKLPRLSKTDRPGNLPEEPEQAGGGQVMEYSADDRGAVVGAEAWISLVIGVILILFFRRIWQYYLMPGSFTWTFTDKQGLPLAYTKTAFYLVDLGVALFAVTLFLDALAMVCRRSVMVRGGVLVITIGVILLNIGVVVGVMGEIGVQIMPVLAAGFGIYNAMYQWARLKRTLMGRGQK